MLASFAIALAPFALNAAVGIVKWLSGVATTAGKRFVLVLLSLIGVLSYSAYSGAPLDPNSIGSLLQAAFETLGVFLAAHGSYHLFWAGKAAQ